MLKSVSSITNAIGALNFKGTWDANANSPALASSVGTKGDYYVVGTAGSTNLNGISNWGVGDLATFNGSVWQRVEGGADLNGVNLSVSGTSTLSNLTASTALALNASKEIVSVTNTGTGDNVLATAPTLVGNVTLSTGNLIIGTSGKGIDFSATPGTGTSELLNDYEEGTWTPAYVTTGGSFTYSSQQGTYVKIGRMVYVTGWLTTSAATVGTGAVQISGLPFSTNVSSVFRGGIGAIGYSTGFSVNAPTALYWTENQTLVNLQYNGVGETVNLDAANLTTGANGNYIFFTFFYPV
jgi:hypothetical protein